MRVLHIGKFYPPFAGGMENFLADLLPALEKRNVRVKALVHGHEFGRKGACPTVSDPAGVCRVPSYGSILYAPISPAFPLALNRNIRSFRPHILHMHLPNTSAFWAMAIPSARRIPWIVQWQSDVVTSRIDRRLALAYSLYRPLERGILKRAHTVIVASPPYLETSLPLARWREKCRVVPLGLDEHRLDMPGAELRHRAERMWRPGMTRVISVGRLTYYKGHEILERAAARLPGVHVLIVGEGERMQSLRRLIARLRIEDRVGLTGCLPNGELRALLASSDILCLPSVERTEAFGLVLLEAMRYSKPVVATSLKGSGVGWIVDQMETGILVKPGCADDLARGLRLLREDPELRKRMGEAGKKKFDAVFRIDRVAHRIIELYRGARESHPG